MILQNAFPASHMALGVVVAENLQMDAPPAAFEARLGALLQRRRQPLSAQEEGVRKAVRALLRNGRYKPRGRGKPASEYLLRAAGQGPDAFPRINAAVDICNYISLDSLLPVSLWDLDLAGTERFVFRLGAPREYYVFNAGGQVIEVEDLLVGCRVGAEDEAVGVPVVNPVKDSLATKTTGATTHVAACVYTPLTVVPAASLSGICAAFAELLAGCGLHAKATHGLALPGQTITCTPAA